MTSISNVVPFRSGKPKNVSFFQQALHAASCPILIIQATTAGMQNIVHANTAFHSLTGYAAQDILEQDWSVLFDHKLDESAHEGIRAPAATSNSPTRGLVKIPHLTGAGRADDYAPAARLATFSAASLSL